MHYVVENVVTAWFFFSSPSNWLIIQGYHSVLTNERTMMKTKNGYSEYGQDKAIELSIKEWMVLAKEGIVVPLAIRLHGRSMEPTIRYIKDQVTVIPINRRLIPGDIVLFECPDGKYIIHRFYRFVNNSNVVQTWGDNCKEPDPPMPVSSVLGIVAYRIRNGERVLLDSDEQRKKGIMWLEDRYRRYIWLKFGKMRRIMGRVLGRQDFS